jgi:DNA-binding winged helix-turn-helix (wHTH) protein
MKKPVTSIELHVTQRQLRIDGAVVTLGGRAFDVLLALASRSGSIVTKPEIFAAAWPGLTVDDNSLQAHSRTTLRCSSSVTASAKRSCSACRAART